MTYQELVNKINFKKNITNNNNNKNVQNRKQKPNAEQIHSPKHCNVQLMKLCER